MNTVSELVMQVMQKNKNDKHLSTVVMEFVGKNICERCYTHRNETLTFVAAFKGRQDYAFRAKQGVELEFKKYCKTCLNSKASKVPIYVEIPENELVHF